MFPALNYGVYGACRTAAYRRAGSFFHGGHLTDLINKQAFTANGFKTDQIAQLGSFLLNQRLNIGTVLIDKRCCDLCAHIFLFHNYEYKKAPLKTERLNSFLKNGYSSPNKRFLKRYTC